MSNELSTPINGLRENFNWIIIGAGGYLLLSLLTYNPHDPGWSYVGPHDILIQNAGGVLGAWSADLLIYFFGYVAFLIPSIMIWRSLIAICWDDSYLSERMLFFALRWIGFLATLISGAMLAELYILNSTVTFPAGTGGALGQFLTPLMLKTLQPLGSVLTLTTTFAIGITIISGLSWLKLIEAIGALICTIVYWVFWPILILIPTKKKVAPVVTETSENSVPPVQDDKSVPIITTDTTMDDLTPQPHSAT